MDKWHISEFSKITGVSVRTLHHYDNIGLLKASERQANRFRLYGENDLQILLQILSLKFLGFELSTIKGLLCKSLPAQEHFLAQKKLLDGKIDKLTKASKILEDIAKVADSVPLDLILKLIEVYRISHQLEKTRIKKLLPQPSQEKSIKYKERIYRILQQISVTSDEELLKECAVFLKEVYSLVPDAMRHQQDSS